MLLCAIFYEGTKRKSIKICSAICVGDKDFNEPKLTKMEYDFIIRSPEALFREENWRDRLQNPEYQRKIKLIVVDKAPKMVHWYVTVYLKKIVSIEPLQVTHFNHCQERTSALIGPSKQAKIVRPSKPLYDHQNTQMAIGCAF